MSACVSLLSQLCTGFGAQDSLDRCPVSSFSGVVVIVCDDRHSSPPVLQALLGSEHSRGVFVVEA